MELHEPPRDMVNLYYDNYVYVAGRQDDQTERFKSMRQIQSNLQMMPENSASAARDFRDYSFGLLAGIQGGKDDYRLVQGDASKRIGGKVKHRAEGMSKEMPPESMYVEKVATQKSAIPDMPGQDLFGRPPFRSMMSGASGRGKTTLLVHCYKHFWAPYFDKVIIFSPNYVLDDSYRQIDKVRIPDRVFEVFKPEHFKIIVEEARRQVPTVTNPDGTVNKAKLAKLKFSTNDLPAVLVWVDDFAFDSDVQGNAYMEMLVMLGRHLNVSIVNVTQKYNKLSRTYRTNVSSLFLFGTENSGELEDISKEHTGGILNPRQFKRMFNDVTGENPWDFLSINTSAPAIDSFRKGLAEVVDLSSYFDDINEQTTVVSVKVIEELRKRKREKGSSSDASEGKDAVKGSGDRSEDSDKKAKLDPKKWRVPGWVKGPGRIPTKEIFNVLMLQQQ